jgi:hypothetical protein
MCYYQSPNRIEPENLPGEQPKAPGKGCLKFTRLGYPGVLCCVGAVNRILPNFIMHLWMATEDHGLAATLYGPCSVTALAGANIPVRLTSQTAYPFEESIRVTVEPEQKADFPLYFRVPSWCANARISINGSWRKMTPDAKGFVRVKRTWSRGDTVKLIFPMSVKLSYGHETEYPLSNREYFSFKPDEVFQKRRFPFESVSYGPLLFALPIPDIDANTRVAEARWQFALDTNPNRNGADIRVKHLAMPAKWDWPLNAPVALYAPARAFDWRPTNDQALPATCVEGGKQEMIRLVPYGCTKFRISMFPVTARAWAQQTGP